MLILTRNIGESIIINNNIKLTVLNITRNTVRVGIDAPQNISVNREEIQQKINSGEKK